MAVLFLCFFFFNDTATTEIYTLSLHDALPILVVTGGTDSALAAVCGSTTGMGATGSSFIFLTAALIFQRGVTCEGGSIGTVASGLLRGIKAIFLTRSTGVIDLLSSSFSSS